jgi:Family of unknown function (DUF5719)
VSPAHGSPERRWAVLAVVGAVVIGVGLVATTRGTPTPSAPGVAATLVGAPDAESSAWYCTGQSTASGGGGAVGGVVLSNTSAHAVDATVDAVSETGASAHVSFAVPAHDVTAPALPALSSGSWQADTVTLSGGGVAVSQVVQGPAGWSATPCASTTSSQWYFAGGTTSGANGLYLSLLNPTPTPVVVDLTFVTPNGPVHPINYQGIVLQPGQVVVEDVGSEIQNVSPVSTAVAVRTGRVVATQLQLLGGSTPGLALVPGVSSPQSHWSIPQAQEVSGGTSEIDVFNPGSSPESVTVHLRVPSGPLAPLSSTVAPGSTWALVTSSQTRIPQSGSGQKESYSADLEASGADGVVVARTVVLPSSATAPQAGMANAVDERSMASPSHQWVVPPPGTSARPAPAGAAPASLALVNTSGATERYTAVAVSPASSRVVATGVLAPGQSVVVSGSPLAAAGLDQIAVRSDGPMAVSEDVAPSGGVGVVTMPGVPLAPPIGL